ncbi:acyltransferase [Planctomicrobium piriforme]|uniref:UDP-2-acetamido-3-amino-2,3-dideoxy-glucuronate N-acetyltransferase n=1 Tax=Planctomicrobium piriforme TaxID=1576369 RepID=A0A1I3C4L0_9PLAN|nr:acyltransferase [Planctomicrobium piriforme]SFH69266.1 UDP-2-acetamido-3-amino-2,3-dideoxy-glucuronate N-acetyltransferase [Planctomicrobium piriforme]
MTTPAYIHPSSYVDDGVELGAGTRIWHFSHILKGVKIGDRCNIGQNVVIGPDVEIGSGVKIQNNVSVYRGVTLEDEVFCGPSMVFTNILTPRAGFPRNRPEDDLRTVVKKGASLGANCTIVCGVTIGSYALIGAGTVVTKDVPAHGLVYGNPGRHRGWACHCGIVLETLGSPDHFGCPDCGRSYQLLADQQLVLLAERAACA